MAIAINGSGTVTGISVGGLPDGIVDAGTLASNSVETAKIVGKAVEAAKIGDGGIIQVVSSPQTATAAQDHSNNTNYSGISWNCTITPTSTDNKILVFYTISFCTEIAGREMSFRATRGGTPFHTGDGAGSRHVGYVNKRVEAVDDLQSVNFHVVDSPNTTSAVNYGFQHTMMSSGGWLVRNRSWTDSDSGSYVRGASQITAMEIVD